MTSQPEQSVKMHVFDWHVRSSVAVPREEEDEACSLGPTWDSVAEYLKIKFLTMVV